VIRDYMRGTPEPATPNPSKTNASTLNTSTNQMRFSEIRNFMDKSSEQYYRRQEMTRIYNEVLERKKAEAATAAAVATKEAVMPTISETCESATPSKL